MLHLTLRLRILITYRINILRILITLFIRLMPSMQIVLIFDLMNRAPTPSEDRSQRILSISSVLQHTVLLFCDYLPNMPPFILFFRNVMENCELLWKSDVTPCSRCTLTAGSTISQKSGHISGLNGIHRIDGNFGLVQAILAVFHASGQQWSSSLFGAISNVSTCLCTTGLPLISLLVYLLPNSHHSTVSRWPFSCRPSDPDVLRHLDTFKKHWRSRGQDFWPFPSREAMSPTCCDGPVIAVAKSIIHIYCASTLFKQQTMTYLTAGGQPSFDTTSSRSISSLWMDYFPNRQSPASTTGGMYAWA